jgi:hypothetical protein
MEDGRTGSIPDMTPLLLSGLFRTRLLTRPDRRVRRRASCRIVVSQTGMPPGGQRPGCQAARIRRSGSGVGIRWVIHKVGDKSPRG